MSNKRLQIYSDSNSHGTVSFKLAITCFKERDACILFHSKPLEHKQEA